MGESRVASAYVVAVSSTLVRIPSRGSILLDAGEGTYGQLARHFGPGVGDVLRDLRCIFVSHIHGDHHTGVAKILAKRRQVCVQSSSISSGILNLWVAQPPSYTTPVLGLDSQAPPLPAGTR
jgi:ribonuclease BN (tRNA processing enzyme)